MRDLPVRLAIAARQGVTFAPRSLRRSHLDQFLQDVSHFQARLTDLRARLARQMVWRDEAERKTLRLRFGEDYRREFGESISVSKAAGERLAQLETSMKALRERVHKAPSAGTRGAPRRRDVHVMLISLADLFQEHDLPVKKTRTGLFVSVAEVLHPDTRDPRAPVTIAYPLIRRAIDWERRHREYID